MKLTDRIIADGVAVGFRNLRPGSYIHPGLSGWILDRDGSYFAACVLATLDEVVRLSPALAKQVTAYGSTRKVKAVVKMLDIVLTLRGAVLRRGTPNTELRTADPKLAAREILRVLGGK
ncbi:MAG TPA: hypothetical protein VHM70_26375 [Polyangiaceae bacterium]|jgi:hypothetical protein|nr:hypothetical protein [Polyangiaceae bacterium]